MEAFLFNVFIARADNKRNILQGFIFLSDLQNLAPICRHKDIEQHHIDFVLAVLKDLQGFFAIASAENIKIIGKDRGHDLAIDLLVINHQNGLLDGEEALLCIVLSLFFAHSRVFTDGTGFFFLARNYIVARYRFHFTIEKAMRRKRKPPGAWRFYVWA